MNKIIEHFQNRIPYGYRQGKFYMFLVVVGAVPVFKLSASNSIDKVSVVFLSLVCALQNPRSVLSALVWEK